MAGMTGGKKLDAYLKQIAGRIEAPGTLRVGFLEGATYRDGTSVPMVAAIQEFGAPAKGIPPRPYFRSMIAQRAPEWGGILAGLLVTHGYDGETALRLMGDGIAGQLRDSIVALTAPLLAPATIAAKGSAKPLVDTGHMLNSVDYAVDTK